jgi:hypothetical protein
MTVVSSILLISGTSDERISLLLRDLRAQLSRAGVSASFVEETPKPGTRSDASVWTQLALGVISGGSLVALIDCLKSYISRERKIVFEIRNVGGSSLSVSAENIDDPSLHALLESVTSAAPKGNA